VGVCVNFAFVTRVCVIMRSMIPCVIMGVRERIARMVMFVLVFVSVLVGMCVGVLMRVLGITVGVLMRVGVCVFVRVSVGMFMVAVHN
jgi:hypothetical protein